MEAIIIILGVGVSIIGYFLKGIHSEIKNISVSLTKVVTDHAVTANDVKHLKERLDKLET